MRYAEEYYERVKSLGYQLDAIISAKTGHLVSISIGPSKSVPSELNIFVEVDDYGAIELIPNKFQGVNVVASLANTPIFATAT